MATELASIVLFAGAVDRTVAFSRAVGVALEHEDHGDGARHAAADLGEIHFAVFPGDPARDAGPAWREAGGAFVGFYVPSLDAALAALETLGATVLVPHQQRAWGCRVVVEDPDGRAVEVNQRDHCESV
jgi:predicted enzyme related to lactoylglutathione lyase